MKTFIIKVELTGDNVAGRLRYALDLDHAKEGQLGDKLLCAPLTRNIPEGLDPIKAIVQPAEHLQANRNSYLAITISYPPGVIRSPRQINGDLDRVLFHVSQFCYVTTPQEYDQDGKRKRKPKNDRQLRVSLCEQPGVFGCHINTDNVHAQGGISTVHAVFLQNIRINDGLYILAFAYARQEVLRERGLIAEDDRLYLVKVEDGRNVVAIDFQVKARREERAQATGRAEDLGQGVEVVGLGDEVEQVVDRRQDQDPLAELAAEWFRGRQHLGKIFRAFCAKYYPDGPKQLARTGELSAIERRRLDRRDLDELLRKNNMGLKTGELGGLVLVANREHSIMREVDERWTKAAVEALTGSKGKWTLGLVQEKQKLLLGKWNNKEAIKTYAPHYADLLGNSPQPDYELPWGEYLVSIRTIGGSSQRRMTLAEVEQFITEYRAAAVEERLVLGKPGPDEKQMAKVFLSPALDAGWRSVTVHDIKCHELETAKALDPNLVLKEVCDGVGNHSATYTMRYPLEQGWEGKNSISLIGNDLVRVLGGTHWTTSFALPAIPLVRKLGQVPTLPMIVGKPHARVSEALQSLLPSAWQRLVAEERAEMVKTVVLRSQQAGLDPAEVVARLTRESPLRPPLRQVMSPGAEALALGQRLVPVPTQRQQQPAKEQDKDKKTTQPTQVPTPVIEDEEEERRKRKRIDKEQSDLRADEIEADQSPIRER